MVRSRAMNRPYLRADVFGLQSPPIRHVYMAAALQVYAMRNPGRAIRLLEIGSWAGASTLTWADAICKHAGTGSVLCIDPWKPYFDERKETGSWYRRMNEAASTGASFEKFKRNIEQAGIASMVDFRIGTTRDVAPSLEGESFDIVYVDGSHLCDDVRYDIEQAGQLLRAGGLLTGDDLELQLCEVDSDAHRAALAEGTDFVWSERAAGHYHPGVTQAVSELVGAVSSYEGFWVVSKSPHGWCPLSMMVADRIIPAHLRGVLTFRDTYKGYNIFQASSQALGVSQSIGEVDLGEGPRTLQRRFGARSVITGRTAAVIRRMIDHIVVEKHLEGN